MFQVYFQRVLSSRSAGKAELLSYIAAVGKHQFKKCVYTIKPCVIYVMYEYIKIENLSPFFKML